MNRRRPCWPAVQLAALSALALLIAGCGFLGGSPDSATTRVAGAAVTPTSETAAPELVALTNANWDLAVQDADRYRGSPVDITGQIFYAIGDYEGASHYQLFTDPRARTGNTHLALPLGLIKLREGDNVRVVGTLERMLVVSSRGGGELRLPYVSATSLEILSGPSGPQTVLAPPEPTAAPTPLPTDTPPPTETPPPTDTPQPTEAPPSPTAEPPTETPLPAPTATAAAPATAVPAQTATALSAATATASARAPSETATGPFQVDLPATSFAPTSEMLATADPGAPSGLYYSSAKSTREWNRGAPIPADAGAATVSFEVPKSGRHAVWVRMHYQHVDANSLWLVVDRQRAILLGNEDGGYGVWKWVGWQEGNPVNRLNVDLSAGPHTLTLVSREAGTRFDALLITADLNFRPPNPSGQQSAPAQPAAPTVLSSTAITPTPVPPSTPTTASRATSQAAAATRSPSPVPKTDASPPNTPTRVSSPPAPAPSTPTPQPSTYTVQPGDTLSAIAARVYGDPSQYRRIFDANRDQLSSPDRISPGQQLRIPR